MTGASAGGNGAGLTRRQLVGGGLILAAVVGVPLYLLKGPTSADAVASDRQRALVKDVSQIVIPRTDTPGAGEVGVGDFVILALAHGLIGTGEPPSKGPAAGPAQAASAPAFTGVKFDYLLWLETALDDGAGGDWSAAPEERRVQALQTIDAAAFPPGPPPAQPSPWQAIKALILTGYYTSQVGGSEELAFELVPGRFDPDIPLTPAMRAWSNDWTAVEFG